MLIRGVAAGASVAHASGDHWHAKLAAQQMHWPGAAHHGDERWTVSIYARGRVHGRLDEGMRGIARRGMFPIAGDDFHIAEALGVGSKDVQAFVGAL